MQFRVKEDLGSALGSLSAGGLAKTLLLPPQQEDDLDGIHIVAFAEESDPGEGGLDGMGTGVLGKGTRACLLEYRLHS